MTKPPNKLGPTLSAWADPQATRSPSIAKGSKSFCAKGRPINSFAAKTPATAEAADEPNPEPKGISLCNDREKPCSGLPINSRNF